MSFQLHLCENPHCSQPTGDSLNPGVKRKYCGYRCANQVSQARYRARSRGTAGDGEVGVVSGHPFVNRTMAPSAAAAKVRYHHHLEHCFLAKGGRCPARIDPYDLKRQCLIHAVVREDWDQLRRAESGIPWAREKTTENGFWIEAPIASVGDYSEGRSTGDLDDFVRFGGGIPENPPE